MEYITESRGGYDEWSDKYQAILGIRFEDGTEIRSKQVSVFTDTQGNELDIELPMRKEISSEIRIERYEPSYEFWTIPSLSLLEEYVDFENKTIDISNLNKQL